jgi:hypothetical protein
VSKEDYVRQHDADQMRKLEAAEEAREGIVVQWNCPKHPRMEPSPGCAKCKKERRCCACGADLKYCVDTDADGVTLTTCGGCAGELMAFMVYGDEAVCRHDWRAIRERVGGDR